jgi:hypothetical protein
VVKSDLSLLDVFVGACLVVVGCAIVLALWHAGNTNAKKDAEIKIAQVESCEVPGADPQEIAICVKLLDG